MSEINVKIVELDNAITKLQGLQKKCTSRNTTPPTTVGGGKTINELEEIASIYKSLNTDFSGLISYTIAFMQKVKNYYLSADQKSAKNINK